MRLLSVIMALAISALTAGIALATPSSDVAATPIARATFANAINTSQMAGRQSVIQQLIIQPGGHTGWHTHPGGTIILVQAGTFSVYNDQCARTITEERGGTFEVGGHVQLARNEGAIPLLLTVLYLDVPVGGGVRSDAATPACAVGADANNLPEGPAGSGVTFNVPGGILQRSTHTAAATITSAPGRDVVIQMLTFAPGGHSGWHSHPGATVVHVESSADTFYLADCMRHSVPAGEGVVEPPATVHVAKNEGTVPLVLRAVYFDVPAGSAPRIDQPEPSTCTGIVAGAAATTAPTAAPTAAPRTLPSTSAGPIGSADPAIVAAFGGLASLAGLAVIGRARRRSRAN